MFMVLANSGKGAERGFPSKHDLPSNGARSTEELPDLSKIWWRRKYEIEWTAQVTKEPTHETEADSQT